MKADTVVAGDASVAGVRDGRKVTPVRRLTGIAWTEKTWALWGGCDPESTGCLNCYAIYDAWRLGHNPATPAYQGLVIKDPNSGRLKWSGDLHYLPNASGAPLRWRDPLYVFVSSMTDVHLPAVPHAWRVELYATMAVANQHTYQTLTKHAEALRDWLRSPPLDEIARFASAMASAHESRPVRYDPSAVVTAVRDGVEVRPLPWPLPNVWVGVSAETQQLLERRALPLSESGAAVTFLSAEPCIEELDGRGIFGKFSQVVFGGESERRRGAARPFRPAWAERILGTARDEKTAPFLKQFGRVWARERDLPGKGDDPSQWEPQFRVQEMPKGARPPAPKRHSLPVVTGAP